MAFDYKISIQEGNNVEEVSILNTSITFNINRRFDMDNVSNSADEFFFSRNVIDTSHDDLNDLFNLIKTKENATVEIQIRESGVGNYLLILPQTRIKYVELRFDIPGNIDSQQFTVAEMLVFNFSVNE